MRAHPISRPSRCALEPRHPASLLFALSPTRCRPSTCEYRGPGYVFPPGERERDGQIQRDGWHNKGRKLADGVVAPQRFLGVFGLRTGAEIVLLSAVINKVSGVFGVLSIITGLHLLVVWRLSPADWYMRKQAHKYQGYSSPCTSIRSSCSP